VLDPILHRAEGRRLSRTGDADQNRKRNECRKNHLHGISQLNSEADNIVGRGAADNTARPAAPCAWDCVSGTMRPVATRAGAATPCQRSFLFGMVWHSRTHASTSRRVVAAPKVTDLVGKVVGRAAWVRATACTSLTSGAIVVTVRCVDIETTGTDPFAAARQHHHELQTDAGEGRIHRWRLAEMQ
jgi:hypothetical protein